ncbi:hypothetical protein G6F56_005186 [Rhizopus delemar]|nr:hypothetical protein G6F56_005186 [Rhizopus delemar]
MANHSQFIENLVERRSECTLEEISLLLQEEFPEDSERRLSVSAVHKHLVSNLNFTLKKAEVYSERRNHEEIRQKRYDYVNKIVSEERVHYGQNCVFVDETGFNLHVNRTQARARRNEPARIVVPSSSKGRNVTIFGAISHRGVELLAKHNTNGTTRSNNFLDFTDGLIEHLDRIGAQGSYVVYDNAPIHGTAAAQKLEAAGYNPLKLPPWSPFLNPIEECFSKLKNGVKKHKLHNQSDLLNRITQSADAITANDCQGWIRHLREYFSRCLRMDEML